MNLDFQANSETYSGIDELEVMRFAQNYNASLLNIVGSQIQNRQKVLDFGAGNGLFASLIQKKYEVTPDCLEPDSRLAEKIQAAMGSPVFSSLEKVPNQAYDLIYSFNVLEHIENDLGVLKELKRKLKPSGILIIYVPAFMILYSSNDRRVGHFRRYTKKTLGQLILNSELKSQKIEYFDPLGFLAALAYKILPGNDDGTISEKSIKFFDRFIFPLNFLLNPISKRFFGKNVLAICSVSGN